MCLLWFIVNKNKYSLDHNSSLFSIENLNMFSHEFNYDHLKILEISEKSKTLNQIERFFKIKLNCQKYFVIHRFREFMF